MLLPVPRYLFFASLLPFFAVAQLAKVEDERKDWEAKLQDAERRARAAEEEGDRLRKSNDKLSGELAELRAQVRTFTHHIASHVAEHTATRAASACVTSTSGAHQHPLLALATCTRR
jgi:septal ring factor EnvC (AmiA/AmiB activator)